MSLQNHILSIQKLHENLSNFSKEDLKSLAWSAEQNNPWFTEGNFFNAYDGVLKLISPESLRLFSEKYDHIQESDKTVGLILAGNIPAVGFHDILICLLSGARIKAKLSSEDKILIPFILNELQKIDSSLAQKCEFVQKIILQDVDAIIATGSNNTARYFEQYFASKPNIIRKSRTSVAILDGTETEKDLELLTNDIVQYFGLGCRNVSKILVLADADIIPLLQKIEHRADLNNFSKYDNNYLYYKSIYLVNREPFLDTETMLFKETELLHSPISVLYYQRFKTSEELNNYLKTNEGELQCIVGKNQNIAFGQAQNPNILDYPDGVDIVDFLTQIK
jgi:hypothetical protein